MARGEGTAQFHPALLSAMNFHFDRAWNGMQHIVLPHDNFFDRIRAELPYVPTRNVSEFMQDCIDDDQT